MEKWECYNDMSRLAEALLSLVDSKFDNALPKILWKEFSRISHEYNMCLVKELKDGETP